MEKKAFTSVSFKLHPIGFFYLTPEGQVVDLAPELLPALHGLELHSHVWLIFYFHENETSPDRQLLQVHPCRNPANPLVGVFATRSPVRPNLIGLSLGRLRRLEGTRIYLEPGLDLRDGTPILDIKPYFPGSDCVPEARAPRWHQRPPEEP